MSLFRNPSVIAVVLAVHMALLGGGLWSKQPVREKVNHSSGQIVSYGFLRLVEKSDIRSYASMPDMPKLANFAGSRSPQFVSPSENFTAEEKVSAQTVLQHDLPVEKTAYRTTYFFDSDAVDEVAHPDENFDALLQQAFLLPPSSFAVAFWISSNGETIDVEYLDGNSQLPRESLTRLQTAKFRPAQKNGIPVPSMKIIQIESPLSFSL